MFYGGPGGARTLDTLLKSVLTLDRYLTPTPVISLLMHSAIHHLLGQVAVSDCGNFDATTMQGVVDNSALRAALRQAAFEKLRRRSFPYSLLGTPLSQSRGREALETLL